MRVFLAVFIMAWGCFVSLSYASGADRLMLTEAEMQKLKKYFPADDMAHMTWKGDPITIFLPLAKEKRIIFSSHVTVDVRGALTTDQLRLLNNDKSILSLSTFCSRLEEQIISTSVVPMVVVKKSSGETEVLL